MGRLIECVPNFSEGRRKKVVERIVESITLVKGIRVLDCSCDAAHNRSVVTFVGEPEAVKKAAFGAVKTAAKLINMERHRGEHPRIGAADVVPLIPLSGTTMEQCVILARELGAEIAEKLKIPVYLYEEAAFSADRRNLAAVRRGEYEGLKKAMELPARRPDFGPSRPHPTAGATAVGARPPLIAYNINLDSSDLQIARAIARSIRGSSGGYPGVKALGIFIEESATAQVTINLCNYREISLAQLFERVKGEAALRGVGIGSSEIVGLVPAEALIDTAAAYLRLQGFHPGQVLEKRMAEE
ncbi:MAG: glutamate formimidoyltransferase [Firmicutes bacterium]|jgi:glutamate formiminotransferase|nr:glutamate formimidoyltransferase [Bacillota bacterium]